MVGPMQRFEYAGFGSEFGLSLVFKLGLADSKWVYMLSQHYQIELIFYFWSSSS